MMRVLRLAAVLAVGGTALRLAAAQPPPRDGPPNPFSRAVEYAQARCVKIYGSGAGREAGYATGIIVSPDGDILTAQGMYLAGERLRVVLPDGTRHEARVVRRSEKLQVALLKIDARTPAWFDLASAAPVRPGDWVLAVSNAFNVATGDEPLSVSVGIVSLRAEMEARHRTQDVPYEGEIIVIDAITSNPGAQGGALCDLQGRLVGMLGKLFQSVHTRTRINYAVPAEMLQRFVEGRDAEPPPAATADAPGVTGGKERAGPPAPPPDLGIRLLTLSGDKAPPYVDAVVSGSPAHAAGVRKDDMVLAVGNTVVRNCRDYADAVKSLRPGEPVTLLLKRDRTILPVIVKPGVAPEGGP